MKYCIVGKVPPPLGGVTVYVKRRLNQLTNEGKDCLLFDLSSFKQLLLLPFKRFDVIEVNSVNFFLVIYFFLTFKIRCCHFVDHNGSRHYRGFKKEFFKWIMLFAGRVNVVNEALIANYKSGTRISVVCPFIPPDLSEEETILSTYPYDVRQLLLNGTFFVNSAWKFIPHDSSDLYGIATSLKLLKETKNSVMLLAIAEYNSECMPDEIKFLIRKFISERRLYLLIGQKELWPVFKYSRLSLRLTPTDGDSVSVREALYFKCNVLASNAVARPAQCITYDYNDFNDLLLKFKRLL